MPQFQHAAQTLAYRGQVIPQANPHHAVVTGGLAFAVAGGMLERFQGMETGLRLTTPSSKSPGSSDCRRRRRTWQRLGVPAAPPRHPR